MKRLGNMICKLNGKKSQVAIGDTYENLKIQAAIRAVYFVTGDDKCGAVMKDYGAYVHKITDKAAKHFNRGLDADAIISKLIGKK